MEATQSAQRRFERRSVPQRSLLQRRPAAVGVGIAWVIFSVCLAWWLGAPYLQSAPENIDPLQIARVSEAFEFSTESEQKHEPAKDAANSLNPSPSFKETDTRVLQPSAFERAITRRPMMVFLFGGILTAASILIALWALRQLWMIQRQTVGPASSTASVYRVTPSMIAHPTPSPSQSKKRDAVKSGANRSLATSRPIKNDSSNSRLMVPRARPPQLQVVQSRSMPRPSVLPQVSKGKRRRPDFDRIVAEMSLAQGTLARDDSGYVHSPDGGKDKDAA